MMDAHCLFGNGIRGGVKAQLVDCKVVGDDIGHGQQQDVCLKIVVGQPHALHTSRGKHGASHKR